MKTIQKWLALLVCMAVAMPLWLGRAEAAGEGGLDLSAMEGGLAATTTAMMNDPQMLQQILSLTEDPQFKKVLEDPELMQAISSGNLNALLTSPAFMKLLEHPIVDQVLQKGGQ
ncbi:MAG: hypothetical protein HQL52_15780 [Magnetococcales bacterium]|nr:hypothetical protein [Magnetococcales bacterium]